ncbi:MAG: UDP-3-O-(3-hydroxymyristoyl)glucosamine N-acyltransferase [Phycisphaerales bacterium]|nr:UDP-3-O-(3-hydroxymyristoyl)glucosamine N-acyltransferase [Phycisphaerales bacterium]
MCASETPHFTVDELAKLCNGRLAGSARHASKIVRGISSLEEASEDQITWLAEKRLMNKLADCRAAAVIGTEAVVGTNERGLVVADPELAVAQILEGFYVPDAAPEPGIHPSAIVHPSAKLGTNAAVGALSIVGEGAVVGDDTVIHEGVSIGKNVRIGAGTVIFDRCVIYDRCEIGNNVRIHSGVIIGADGFGYIFRDNRHRKLMHLGTVVIEDEVEIGANSCIDRGKLGATRVGRGSKIDNLVMIAHNVHVGPNCIIIAQCGLAGSCKLGEGVMLAGHVGVVQGVTIGPGAQLAAKAVATSNVPAGANFSGYPAQDHKTELRNTARIRKLPQLFDKVAELEKRVAELAGSADH